jgi:membrane fusion protein, epimerase transport system
VASERKTVQHLEGGIIREILVEEDSRVEAGQVLVRLSDTMDRTRMALLRGQHDAIAASSARLEAERSDSDQIEFPQELLARRDDPQVARLLDGEEQVFRARREASRGESNVLGQRIEQYHAEIVGLDVQVKSAAKQLALIKEELTAAETLYKKGLYEKPRYLALKRADARLEGEVGEHIAKIAEIRQGIAETELRRISLRQDLMKEVNNGLQEARAKIYDVVERMRAAQDSLDRAAIVAPLTGTVVGLNVHTVGGVIGAGERILDIVPANDKLVIIGRVRLEDIDVVSAGAPAEVRLTAYNMRTTVPRHGIVTKVSADRLTDQTTGASFYQIEVEIANDDTGRTALYPGMSAEIYVMTGERTALQYLMRPVLDTLHRGLLEE